MASCAVTSKGGISREGVNFPGGDFRCLVAGWAATFKMFFDDSVKAYKRQGIITARLWLAKAAPGTSITCELPSLNDKVTRSWWPRAL